MNNLKEKIEKYFNIKWDSTDDYLPPKKVLEFIEREIIRDNLFEKACKEYLKGCSVSTKEDPELCLECTTAFIDYIKKINQGIVPPAVHPFLTKKRRADK